MRLLRGAMFTFTTHNIAKKKAFDKSSHNLQVKINGTEPEIVSKIKYLGVFFLDNSFDWKDQVRAVSSKGFQRAWDSKVC